MKQSTSSSSSSFRDFKPKPQRTSKKKKTEAKKLPTRPQTSPSKVKKRKPLWKIVGSNREATIDASTLSTIRGELDVNNPRTATEENDPSGAVRNGWYHGRYQPEFITGCNSCCPCGGEDRIAI